MVSGDQWCKSGELVSLNFLSPTQREAEMAKH
jgi:hypothetical protein